MTSAIYTSVCIAIAILSYVFSNALHCLYRIVYQCSLHKGITFNLRQVVLITACNDHSNGTRAEPDLVSCGGGCSCMLLVQPSATCSNAVWS